METVQTILHSGDVDLPATISLPGAGKVRGGLVALHGATMPSRDWFLYAQLAQVLPEQGYGVLRFDRRAGEGDIPFDVQATDGLAALALLGAQDGMNGAPLGLWGFSQGAWAATVAASRPAEVAFLVLVGAAGVSPAAQMRYGCERQLRLHGYGEADLAELQQLRWAFERFQRGEIGRKEAQATIDRAAAKPWFPLVYIPRRLGEPGSWRDMDFDPRPFIAGVRCPVLLCYGADDEWIPIEESVQVWRESAATSDLSVMRVPDTWHIPVLGGRESIDAISPLYTTALLEWLGAHCP